MDKSILKPIGLCAICGIIWAVILYGIALIITNNKGYNFNDVLFIEGIISLIIGAFSIVTGDSRSLPLRGIGKTNDEFIASTNLILSKIEKDKKYSSRSTSKAGLITVSLLIGGILVTILNLVF